MKPIDFISKLKFNFLGKSKEIIIETTLQNDKNKEFKENEERLKKLYYIAVKTRNFEIGQLGQRNNFFMIFQGVLLACMITSKETVPFVQVVISATGFYVAYCQTNVAAGAKFWQEYWEDEVYKAEENLKKFYNDLAKNQVNENLDFIPIFTKTDTEVHDQVFQRLNRKNCNDFPNLPKINLPRLIHFLFLGEKLSPNIFSTKSLILTKPSVSKIPIHVGQCLIISWALLFFSGLGIFNNILESKLMTNFVIRGFPTHQESIKQEIYFSKDTEKIDTVIPLNIEIKDLEKISNNQPINIELSINGQKIEAKGTIK